MPQPSDVTPERSGWRDAELSERHRWWGFNCPAVDVDFLMIEYNLGLPVAVIDYKHWLAKKPPQSSPSVRALRALAESYAPGRALPLAFVRYDPTIWAFQPYPLNTAATQFFESGRILAETDFVRILYQMRQRVVSREIEHRLNNVLPSGQYGLALPWDVA